MVINELDDAALRELHAEEYHLWSAVSRRVHYDADSVCVRYSELATACGISERTVRRVMSALAARGVLYVRKQGQRPPEISLENDYDRWVKKPESRPARNGLSEPSRPARNGLSEPSRPARNGLSEASYQLEKEKEEERVSELSLEMLKVSTAYHSRIRDLHPSLSRGLTSRSDEQGAKALDLLVRIDGHAWELVKDVLRWALTDDFWSRNLRSLASCRARGKNGATKFENCMTQMDLARTESRGQVKAAPAVAKVMTEDELEQAAARNVLGWM